MNFLINNLVQQTEQDGIRKTEKKNSREPYYEIVNYRTRL